MLSSVFVLSLPRLVLQVLSQPVLLLREAGMRVSALRLCVSDVRRQVLLRWQG